eukprot:gene23596-29832_t
MLDINTSAYALEVDRKYDFIDRVNDLTGGKRKSGRSALPLLQRIILDAVYDENIDSLSLIGPISSYGPLGIDGPIGSNAWDPSIWITEFMEWDEWSSATLEGPLSAEGPLGSQGPFTEPEYYQGAVFLESEFNPHTRALSVWGILGPVGPLGAVGALGALGPIGAHGYKINSNGEYVTKTGAVVLTYTVPYDATTSRVFDLYQNYNAAFAQSHQLDTSFMTQDDLANSPKSVSSFNFTSSIQQIVSVLVVPGYADGVFALLTLLNGDGNVIATSDSKDSINFIMFTSQVNEKYTVRVSSVSVMPREALTSQYRLFVTGSTHYLNQNNLIGTYIGASKN